MGNDSSCVDKQTNTDNIVINTNESAYSQNDEWVHVDGTDQNSSSQQLLPTKSNNNTQQTDNIWSEDIDEGAVDIEMWEEHTEISQKLLNGAVDIEIWEEHTGKQKDASKSKLWSNSIVPFKINEHVVVELKILVLRAINEFNTKTPVKWIEYNLNNHGQNYVLFKQNNKKCCVSECIGKNGGEQYVRLPFPNYPNSDYKTGLICVLHEMMHALGFHHEMARQDAIYHCESNKHMAYSNQIVEFGAHDYRSIMYYRNEWGFDANNAELARLADHSPTFSQGDLAVLRRIYGKQVSAHLNGKVHFGEWHKKCGKSCTKTSCKCGSCGVLDGGVNCGYNGINGHWTCCLNEKYQSNCNETHTGFWHMKCTDSRCNDKICFCKSCGGGCTYNGMRAHWSCCNSEYFKGKCEKSKY